MKRVKKFILTVVVINLMLFTISYPLRSYSDKINRVKGDLIVLKLTEYRETHGNYPESLSFLDLNPTETSTISGSSFNYNLKGDAFELSYPSFRNMAGIKISGKSDWIYDY
ncbi:MAG: hypothetical protein JJ975_09770 [Bacteroidia bacterium]|nr:hypothetical protein [Bacteroidia bacterium]